MVRFGQTSLESEAWTLLGIANSPALQARHNLGLSLGHMGWISRGWLCLVLGCFAPLMPMEFRRAISCLGLLNAVMSAVLRWLSQRQMHNQTRNLVAGPACAHKPDRQHGNLKWMWRDLSCFYGFCNTHVRNATMASLKLKFASRILGGHRGQRTQGWMIGWREQCQVWDFGQKSVQPWDTLGFRLKSSA